MPAGLKTVYLSITWHILSYISLGYMPAGLKTVYLSITWHILSYISLGYMPAVLKTVYLSSTWHILSYISICSNHKTVNALILRTYTYTYINWLNFHLTKSRSTSQVHTSTCRNGCNRDASLLTQSSIRLLHYLNMHRGNGNVHYI